jgi:hypothetical protein
MSYETQYALVMDSSFQARTLACCTEQAMVFKADARPNWVATANAILKADGDVGNAFIRLGAAGPGIADKVEQPNGDIDSSLVTDGDLLSLTQANWGNVADLYFTADGAPIEG